MAAADPPAGLMDIASTLSQDDIPFKLRCAICNKLAVNAFRLPCCDQSICETCQTSLSDTCPVCAHTPVSPDLCKPNKALRTTLKAFLRTEEKKREKDRQSTAPPTPAVPPSAASEPATAEAAAENTANGTVQDASSEAPEPVAPKSDEATADSPTADTGVNGTAVNGTAEPVVGEMAEAEAKAEPDAGQAPEAVNGEANTKPSDGDTPVEQSAAIQDMPQPNPNMMNLGAGGIPGMNWNGNGNFNGMNPFMANAMFNFPNQMGMPMSMDPMAANQGMFGDYGMNMTGMGMNMGMNFNGQGMYGSLGWDGSQQNMWHGGQDNFNPNAFANGTGPPYGGAFGGSNMSYPSNSGYQSGYYGPGYGRGGFRGRGRGGFQGPGRGDFTGHNANRASLNQHFSEGGPDGNAVHGESTPQTGEHGAAEQVQEMIAADGTAQTAPEEAGQTGQQLHDIPSFDGLNQSMPMAQNGYHGPTGPGYGRGGFVRAPGGRGPFGGGAYQPHIEQPPGPGVEGAPAAPRAMRQGLPNTSVFRQRGFHAHGKASIGSNTPALSQRANSEVTQDAGQTRSHSRASSQPSPADSRPHSPSQNHPSRQMSPMTQADDDRNGRYEDAKRHHDDENVKDRRSRSPSHVSSSRSLRRHHRDRDRDRREGHRSHRSRRHRSRSYTRSRSPSTTRNGASRHPERLDLITEQPESNGHNTASEAGDRDLATRVSSHRTSKDRASRRDEERDRDRARDSRRRDRDRDRDHDRRERDRESERDHRRYRERDRGPGRDREKERERDKERGRRERDRKRSRRDRSESTHARDDSSRPQARRVKRDAGDDQDRDLDRPKSLATKPEPEKDPYTLEREARNRERMLREQQSRSGAKSSWSKSSDRRGSRQERLVGARRINYKYEDEL